MSIVVSLNTLRGVRDAIRDAIVGKGGTLPVGSPMGSYAQAIADLPSGSGGDTEIPFRSSLTVPGDTDPWHLANLAATSIGTYGFYADKSLTSVSLPAATSIGSSAFQGCSSLTTVSLPAATSISGSAFRDCTSLTTVDFPVASGINTYAFQNCTSLTTVSLPAARNISTYAFQGCSSLTTVSLPAATSLDTSAFRYCSALTSLTLSNTSVATLSATNTLSGTPIADGTGYIYVPDDLVDQYKTATNWSTYANQILPLSQKP